MTSAGTTEIKKTVGIINVTPLTTSVLKQTQMRDWSSIL